MATGDKHFVELPELLLHLQYNDILCQVEGINERLWDQIVVDIYINNNDRNNGNWGVLLDKSTSKYILAPIFDNGASFSPKSSDKQLQGMLADKTRFEKSIMMGKTAYAIDGQQLDSAAMLKLDYPGLKTAIERNIELIKENRDTIAQMISDIPNTFDEKYVCSELRKEFYIESLNSRVEKLLEPAVKKNLVFSKDVGNIFDKRLDAIRAKEALEDKGIKEHQALTRKIMENDER